MENRWTRRTFLASSSALALVSALPATAGQGDDLASTPTPRPESFPQQDSAVVRETVGVSHGNFERVRELVGARPALAKATWDWGFGDWESALGAASHTGNREIALFLIEHGARPTLFSAAMLGQLEVVQAIVRASPGAQRIPGPHSITLLRHAESGGEAANGVVEYLRSLGDADRRPSDEPLDEAARQQLIGPYAVEGDPIAVEIVEMRQGGVGLKAGEAFPRGLSHRGGWEFRPAGAEAVRIRVERVERGLRLSVYDPELVLTASRSLPASRSGLPGIPVGGASRRNG